MDEKQNQAPELKFPLQCHFRVVAEDRPGIQPELEKALRDLGIPNPLTAGNRSSQGKYLTFTVDIHVDSRELMNRIDAAFRAVKGVKMVL